MDAAFAAFQSSIVASARHFSVEKIAIAPICIVSSLCGAHTAVRVDVSFRAHTAVGVDCICGYQELRIKMSITCRWHAIDLKRSVRARQLATMNTDAALIAQEARTRDLIVV